MSSRRWNPSPRRLTSTASSYASQPDLGHASACAPSAASPSSTRGPCPVALGAVCLRADDEGLDVVPSIAVGIIRDALLERAEEVRDETGGAVLAFTRQRAMQERPTPRKHAPHVLPREYGGIFVPVGIVEAEEVGALELETRDAPAARLEGVPDLVQRAHPYRNDDRGDGGGADPSRAAPVAEHPVHVADELDVEPRPLGARRGRGRERGNEPPARRELHRADLEQPLPVMRCGHAP